MVITVAAEGKGKMGRAGESLTASGCGCEVEAVVCFPEFPIRSEVVISPSLEN